MEKSKSIRDGLWDKWQGMSVKERYFLDLSYDVGGFRFGYNLMYHESIQNTFNAAFGIFSEMGIEEVSSFTTINYKRHRMIQRSSLSRVSPFSAIAWTSFLKIGKQRLPETWGSSRESSERRWSCSLCWRLWSSWKTTWFLARRCAIFLCSWDNLG